MRKLASWLVSLAALAMVAGCATPTKMGLTRADTQVDVSKESLAIFSLRVDHAYRPSVTPSPRIVYIEKPGAKEAADRLNFIVDSEAGTVGPDGQEYLIRMSLPPGPYRVVAIGGGGGIAIFPGHFLLPLVADIQVRPGSVAYLGRVEAKTRERQGDEFRAGPVIPLIDQAAAGWSGSTWDVTIRDAYESDLQRFRSAFPALRGVDVRREVMTFDRAKAQAYWEKL